MIQISTPAQALISLNESSSLQETAFTQEQNSTVQKKTAPGIFAKRLEGLTSKVKKGQSDTDSADSGLEDVLKASEGSASDELKGLFNPQGTKKNTILAGQGTKKPAHLEFFDEKEALAGLSALFGQDFFQEEGLTGKNYIQKQNFAGKDFLNKGKYEGKSAKEGIPNLSGSAAGVGDLNQSDLIARLGSGKGKEDAFGAPKTWMERGGAERREGYWLNKAGIKDRELMDFRSFFAGETGEKIQLARQQGGERENPRLNDARAKKGRERLNIEVRDLRSGFDLQAAGREADVSKGFTSYAVRSASAEIEIPVNLKLSGGEAINSSSGKAGSDFSLSRGFEDALARELRGGLSTDIVRDAMVIVRNGGEGTIRLSLRPASLGDVKIRLEMAENKITGHIIVESKEALRAFERELPVLEKAFKDSGFSETNLEMSLAQDGWDFGGREQEQEGEFRSFSPVMAASRYDDESDWIETQDSSGTMLPVLAGRTSVNMFV